MYFVGLFLGSFTTVFNETLYGVVCKNVANRWVKWGIMIVANIIVFSLLYAISIEN